MSNDRGMMKWNAFNALLAHGSSVKKMMLERQRVEKPQLSSDQIEELNLKLTVAIEDAREVEVAFYDKGYILLAEGKILRIDVLNQLVVLPDIKIKCDNIVQIEFKED